MRREIRETYRREGVGRVMVKFIGRRADVAVLSSGSA
jgi:hypothetical protein